MARPAWWGVLKLVATLGGSSGHVRTAAEAFDAPASVDGFRGLSYAQLGFAGAVAPAAGVAGMTLFSWSARSSRSSWSSRSSGRRGAAHAAERRIAAWMAGPASVRTGRPAGTAQPAADGLKNLVKEETLRAGRQGPVHLLAPAISFIPAL